MDQGIVQFRPYPEEKYVAKIEGEKPLVIPCQGSNLNKKTLVIPWEESTETPGMAPRKALQISAVPKATMIIKGPSPIPYESKKAVLWSYDSDVYILME